jgi:hypothetical protein
MMFCDCCQHRDIHHGKVRKVEEEQRLAPAQWWKRIWRQSWSRFSSVTEKVLEVLPTLHENQIVDISTESLGVVLPAHKGFRESDPLYRKKIVQDGSAAAADVARSISPESVNRAHTSLSHSDGFPPKMSQGHSASPTLTHEGTVSPSRTAAKPRERKVESQQRPTESSVSTNLASGDAQALNLGSLFGSQMMRSTLDRLYELELSEFDQKALPTVSALGTSHATAPLRTVVRKHRTDAATSFLTEVSAHTLTATSKRSVGQAAANLHSSVQAGPEERKPRSAPASRLITPVRIPMPPQPNRKKIVQDGSAAAADVARSISPESVNRAHTSLSHSDGFPPKMSQGHSASPTLTHEGTVSPSRTAAKPRERKVESQQRPTESSVSTNLASGDAQALNLGSLFGSQMMRSTLDRLYELELSEFDQKALPTVSALGTSHATAPLRTVVRKHRTDAATSFLTEVSAHTLTATSKRSVGQAAANLHSSVQAGPEERKPRSAPASRLITRTSAAAVPTMKQNGIVLSETAQSDLSHATDAVSAIGNENLRIHIDQGTTGVETTHVRGISRQTRKSLHIPAHSSMQDTSLQEVVVEVDARDVKAPAIPKPKSGDLSSSAFVSDTKTQDISAHWGDPPPFDEEDEKLAKLYQAQPREQAAARAAQARDKGQRSSVVNSASAGSSTSMRGSSLEFKPAPASPRLCVSTPNDVIQEKTKTASRGGSEVLYAGARARIFHKCDTCFVKVHKNAIRSKL